MNTVKQVLTNRLNVVCSEAEQITYGLKEQDITEQYQTGSKINKMRSLLSEAGQIAKALQEVYKHE